MAGYQLVLMMLLICTWLQVKPQLKTSPARSNYTYLDGKNLKFKSPTLILVISLQFDLASQRNFQIHSYLALLNETFQ
jgi:hypothetical protein